MRLALCVALGLALAPGIGHAGTAIMAAADGCVACHGDAGALAALSGQSADHLKTLLAEFKAGHRAATVMDRITRGFSDRQLDAIADYWAAQPLPQPQSLPQAAP